MGWDHRPISLFTQLLSSGCAFQEGREAYLSHSNTVGAALAETARPQMTEDEADRYSLLQQMPFSGSFTSHCLSESVAKPLLTLIDVLLEVWRFIAWQSEGGPASTSQPRCSWRNRDPAPWWLYCCALHWWGCCWHHPFINGSKIGQVNLCSKSPSRDTWESMVQTSVHSCVWRGRRAVGNASDSFWVFLTAIVGIFHLFVRAETCHAHF